MAQANWAGHGKGLMVGSEIRSTETPFLTLPSSA